MKNMRIKVRENCSGTFWDFGIFEGGQLLLVNPSKLYERKFYAIKNAKAMAERIGKPYSDEIIKQHGC